MRRLASILVLLSLWPAAARAHSEFAMPAAVPVATPVLQNRSLVLSLRGVLDGLDGPALVSLPRAVELSLLSEPADGEADQLEANTDELGGAWRTARILDQLRLERL
jgi:hypothetical protein